MLICSTRRMVACGLLLASLGVCAGCTSDGHFCVLGYTTAPMYDESIRTVYVPIFENRDFRRGLEFELTRAVVREIEAKTPYKVVNCREQADTELDGKIVNRRKAPINFNQIGEVREAEVGIAVELQWRDLRPGHFGEFLSKTDQPTPKDQDPAVRLKKEKDTRQNTIIVMPTATFIPELGGSVVSAERLLINRLAVQIVSMMERSW